MFDYLLSRYPSVFERNSSKLIAEAIASGNEWFFDYLLTLSQPFMRKYKDEWNDLLIMAAMYRNRSLFDRILSLVSSLTPKKKLNWYGIVSTAKKSGDPELYKYTQELFSASKRR